MDGFEKERLYPVRQGGVIEIGGNFFEISLLSTVILPIKYIDKNTTFYYFNVFLKNGNSFQCSTDNPTDCVLEYRRVIKCWTGFDVQDNVKLNDLLGKDFFNE